LWLRVGVVAVKRILALLVVVVVVQEVIVPLLAFL
jgi:hypothetical protein